MPDRVALYLQDAHPLADAISTCSTPRIAGLRRSGRPKAA